MSVLQQITEHESTTKEQADREYREVVRRLASDEDPTLEEVQAALAAVGKGSLCLEADVQLARRRDEWRSQLRDAEDARRERGEIDDKLQLARRELHDAQERFNQTVWPLQGRLQDLTAIASAASQAERQLFETCDDPELLSQLSVISIRVGDINEKLGEQRALVKRLGSMLSTEKDRWRPGSRGKWLRDDGRDGRGGDPKRVAQLEGRLADAQQVLADWEADHAELLEADRAVREAMLEN